MKADNTIRNKSSTKAVNAEFKHLRKRIEKLESIVFNTKTDNGIVGEPDDVIKKG